MTNDLNLPTIVAIERNEIEAATVANYLIDLGIDATLDGTASRVPYSSNYVDVRVAVRAADAQRARELLAEVRSTQVSK